MTTEGDPALIEAGIDIDNEKTGNIHKSLTNY